MSAFSNLPHAQHAVQRLVDQWNADERLWRKLEPRRRRRRTGGLKLTAKQQKELDLRDFAKAKPPVDCIGEPFST